MTKVTFLSFFWGLLAGVLLIERIQRLHQEAWKAPPGPTYRTMREQQE